MLKDLASEQLMEIMDKYPWFAPARAVLCRRALESSGRDAAISAFNASLLYLPDGSFVAASITRSEDSCFKDSDTVVKSGKKDGSDADKPRIILAGMDYFSREEYESVSDESLKNLGKIAFFEETAGAADNADGVMGNSAIAEVSSTDSCGELVTETLALVYLEQGYNQEAAEIYRKLSLQSPEKSAYFASLIDNLKI